MPTVLPGGAVFADFSGAAPGSLGDLFGGGQAGFGCPTLFKPVVSANGCVGARPASMVMLPNPVTGKPTIFKYAGPILLTGSDVTGHKKVKRLAAKFARRRPR
ncbi:unnamed protein product [marine sediment metagenome]|uniref:Uncharacterized protein n=1 Tax=marine sediment metagenome TaxID=412755 RepID=X1CPT2_9ZZZZ